MHQKLTAGEIRTTCEEMMAPHGKSQPSVRAVMRRLHEKYGACGRTARVAEILRRVAASPRAQHSNVDDSDVVVLREQLAKAEQRAQRAEELERRHQDFWAARYQERVDELQRRSDARNSPGVRPEQYLRLYQRAMELANRLFRYEDVGPLLGPADGPG